MSESSPPYRTPPDAPLPSVFDVREGDVIAAEYAVPNTPFRLARVPGRALLFAVRRDQELDALLSDYILRRFEMREVDGALMTELGEALLHVHREEARGMLACSVTATGALVWRKAAAR